MNLGPHFEHKSRKKLGYLPREKEGWKNIYLSAFWRVGLLRENDETKLQGPLSIVPERRVRIQI